MVEKGKGDRAMRGDFMHPCRNKNEIISCIKRGKKHILCYGDIDISLALEDEIKRKKVTLYPIDRGLKPKIKEEKK